MLKNERQTIHRSGLHHNNVFIAVTTTLSAVSGLGTYHSIKEEGKGLRFQS